MNNMSFGLTFFSFFNLGLATVIIFDRGLFSQALVIFLNTLLVLMMLHIQKRKNKPLDILQKENDYLKNALAWETYKSLSDEERVEVLKNMILPKVER